MYWHRGNMRQGIKLDNSSRFQRKLCFGFRFWQYLQYGCIKIWPELEKIPNVFLHYLISFCITNKASNPLENARDKETTKDSYQNWHLTTTTCWCSMEWLHWWLYAERESMSLNKSTFSCCNLTVAWHNMEHLKLLFLQNHRYFHSTLSKGHSCLNLPIQLGFVVSWVSNLV